ncbi:glycosyltransferase family 4 protein [Vibrio fluvialis]|uniref:glycosyltransferase family 4 protein n=1 Tax=Vibrio fluvialis TaxID=676 RepID=UPI000C225EF5|nr:glycosyltransferase family 4 protein [Vibrio fluvialis]
MRLALIIDDYLPHSTRVGAKMFHELALEFISNGHEVTVITPSTNIDTEFTEQYVEGVRVWYFRSGAIKDVSKVQRAMNETLLSFRAWKAIKGVITPNYFEGVIYYSPSIFLAGLVKKIKTHCQCSTYLILRDFFPQWIIDSGMIKSGSLIDKYFRYFERQTYSEANMIGVMSEKNLCLFREMTNSCYPVQVLRNWSKLTPHCSNRQSLSIRKQLNLENKVIFFYGGNIGHAQDMGNLMRLVRSMNSYEGAHFLFVGQGDEVNLINHLASEWKLSNFTYLPSVSQDRFKDILSEVDIGLFSLSKAHTAHNFPGKLLGYMVQSIPILGSVNSGNDLKEIVNEYEAGFIIENGNDNDLLNKAVLLYEDSSLRAERGSNSYKLLKSQFSVHSIATKIIEHLGES